MNINIYIKYEYSYMYIDVHIYTHIHIHINHRLYILKLILDRPMTYGDVYKFTYIYNICIFIHINTYI
jgi:hypothetical protein